MNRFIPFAVILAFISALSFYFLFSPTQTDKRKVQELLGTLSETVETQDHIKIGKFLDSLLTADAQATLKIGFPALPGEKSKIVETENVNKNDFLHFVDNTLYTLSNYYFAGTVRNLKLEADGQTATVDILGHAHANGSQQDGNVRFAGDMLCEGIMHFDKKSLQVSKLTCVVQLHSKAAPPVKHTP